MSLERYTCMVMTHDSDARYRCGDISLERYIVMVCRALYEISMWRYFPRTIYRDGMSHALRDIAVAIFRWNEISARCRREAPISRRIIVLTCC